MIAAPLLIIFLTSLCGIIFWQGMEFYVLGLPASLHDIFFLFILTTSINLKDRRKNYQLLVCTFVAGLFLVQSFMQAIDMRPPGGTGAYDLYYDNIMNGLYVSIFAVVVAVMAKLKKIRWDARLAVFISLSLVFLSLNLLLTLKPFRSMLADYAIVYDMLYYAIVYFMVISASGAASEFIRYSYNGLSSMLSFWRSGIRGGYKA